VKDEADAIRLAAEIASKRAFGNQAPKLSTSSSRLRIRELLDKHQIGPKDQEMGETGPNKKPFEVDMSRKLWVFK